MKPITISSITAEGRRLLNERVLAPVRTFFSEESLSNRITNVLVRSQYEGGYVAFDPAPACEMIEGNDYYLLTMSLPGVSKESIRVEVLHDRLTISASCGSVERNEYEGHRMSYRLQGGRLKRVVVLPPQAKTDGIQAVFRDEVLWINMPKESRAVVPRRIGIDDANDEFLERLAHHAASLSPVTKRAA